MPCYTMRTNETLLEDRNPNILKQALEDMGFRVDLDGAVLSFEGINKKTGRYESGTYKDGVLTASRSLSVTEVKKSYAAQVAANQVAKLKSLGVKFGRLPDGRLVTYK